MTEEELQGVELQVHEMWSIIGLKQRKRWAWMIYCLAIKQVLTFHVRGRGKKEAQRLLDKLPDRLRQNCSFATDN
ncbi:hypothetical protein E4021_14980 [Neolewinella litorea]|uniref:IS1 family transposase n=1 Tax=Neolewinella litorea TaxID=2562452 RepID=A0A4S4NCZ8_9BACT|nr:hypothetical protein E4021_14980 [Neolewinella litorea]